MTHASENLIERGARLGVGETEQAEETLLGLEQRVAQAGDVPKEDGVARLQEEHASSKARVHLDNVRVAVGGRHALQTHHVVDINIVAVVVMLLDVVNLGTRKSNVS